MTPAIAAQNPTFADEDPKKMAAPAVDTGLGVSVALVEAEETWEVLVDDPVVI